MPCGQPELRFLLQNFIHKHFLFQIEIKDSKLNVTGGSLIFDRLYKLQKLSLNTVTFRGIEQIYTDRAFDFEYESVNCINNGIYNDCLITVNNDGNSGTNSKITASGLIALAFFFQIYF